MYQPNKSDIYYWYDEEPKLLHAVLYLADTRSGFGYRVTKKVKGGISKELLEKMETQLIKEFDLARAAKRQKFMGELKDLKPIRIVHGQENLLTAKELLNV